MTSSKTDLRETRGSVLIVAIIFATVAALAIGSYIRLAGTEMRLSNHQFYGNASLNLAEAGVEEALYALNLSSPSLEDWIATGISGVLEKKENAIELGMGATGGFQVRMEGAGSDTPRVVSEGEVHSGGNGRSVRQVEVTLFRRSLFGNGIMADQITLRGGNIEINSYDSSAEAWEPLESARVASTALEEDSMDLGNAKIHGSVATRGWEPRTRPNTLITDGWTDDFNLDLPGTRLPPGDVIYHQTYDGGPGTLGETGLTTYTRTSSINLSGTSEEEVLRIRGDVVLVVDEDISITGDAQVIIEEGASLQVYAEGDVAVRGGSIFNESQIPSQFQLYGTNPDSQSFDLSGNAAWYGTVYAPNASIDLNGGGDEGEFFGAIVAQQVTMHGNTTFYHDMRLADLNEGGTLAVGFWRELFGEDRVTFDTLAEELL